ncbi:MAG: hypothetical protein IJK97_02040 [Thermoguttaceae bacterium]|nr:hypothetical protein [Thermoguttaceae bacterium]MBR0191486.1 hypothetical protein [Thermoguttaceae bacterium]
MSISTKRYEALHFLRWYRVHNEMVANVAPEYSVYVRPRRRKNHLPDAWDDEAGVCHQKTWKVKRRTQYHPDGRNAYMITIKYKCEKIESSVLTQFATSDEWKTEISSFSYDLKSYERLWEIEEKFQFQGIIIQESWKDPDPETLVGTLCYKVYGDRKEGVRRYMQKKCDRYGEQMEVEYI